MDLRTFIRHSLNESYERMAGTCKGLSREDLAWRPAPHANQIGFILWHALRGWDRMVHRASGAGPEVWFSESAHQGFGLPPESDERLVLSRQVEWPPVEVFLDYLRAVHRSSVRFVDALSGETLEQVPNPEQPERTVAALLRHAIVHTNHHHGQIDFLRGLRHEGWELPRGTGVRQA